MANAENIRKTVAAIDPKRWDQEFFFETSACGTTGCLAGWAAMVKYEEKLSELSVNGFKSFIEARYGCGVPSTGWAQAGKEFFDLTSSQVDFLFYEWRGEVLPDGFDWEKEDPFYDEKTEEYFEFPIELTIDNLKRTLTMVTGVTFE